MTSLVVDIGNTTTCVGLTRRGRVWHVARTPSGPCNRERIRTALEACVGTSRIDSVALCSVVPAATAVWCRGIKRVTGMRPLIVDHTIQLGVRIRYPQPATIGSDRLANACGAAMRYGVPVIVADFGTALTFDVIAADGAYIGGVIAPGLCLMTDYLAEKTALLPHIRLPGRIGAVGKSTAGAMRIGAKIGYRGIVREIVHHLQAGLGSTDITLCATGGFAKWAIEELDMPFIIDPNLTLYGLGRILELNSNRQQAPSGCRTPAARADGARMPS